jgi:hypothetical protein
MNVYKTQARAFGICFILAFLSYGIGSGLIDSLISRPDFLSQVHADNTSIVMGAVLIGLVHSFVNIALPVIMLPILKPYSATLAYGYLSAAIIATTILALGSIFLLMLIPLSHEHAKAAISLIPNIEVMANVIKKAAYYSYHLGMALWSIGGLMLVALLYKSKLTPRPLSVLGAIGYLFLVTGSVMALLQQSDLVEIISVIPGGIFEITLSIWLIVKGFKPTATSRAAA